MADRDRRRARPPMALGDGRFALAPDIEVPWWREPDGTRHSSRTLSCGVDARLAGELRGAHLDAIVVIAAAALDAAERGDRRATARLASAAARLCGEIRGLWPPSAVAPRGR